MSRTAPGAHSCPSALKVILPFPLLGRFQILPIKHSGGASSKTVFTEYAEGKFSRSMDVSLHCPFTPLRHAVADGEPSTAPCWDEQDENTNKPKTAMIMENNSLFIIKKKLCRWVIVHLWCKDNRICMSLSPKNHTISKFTVKLLVRLFILLLLFAFAPFILENETRGSLAQSYFYISNKWVFIFPGLLFLSFLTLLILTLRYRYQKIDLNWMLSLNTALLIGYIVLLYIRLYPVIFG